MQCEALLSLCWGWHFQVGESLWSCLCSFACAAHFASSVLNDFILCAIHDMHPRAQVHVLMSQKLVICLSPRRLEILFSVSSPYLPRNHLDPTVTALSGNSTRMNSRHQWLVDLHLSDTREHWSFSYCCVGCRRSFRNENAASTPFVEHRPSSRTSYGTVDELAQPAECSRLQ